MADTSPYASGGFLNVPVGADAPGVPGIDLLEAAARSLALTTTWSFDQAVQMLREMVDASDAQSRIDRALAVLNGAPIPMGEVRARHAAAILRGDRG